MKQVELSIITVNYKVREKLFNCIKSIHGSKIKINFEIIVVDNEGDNNLKNELKNNTKVKYINAFKNLGFGAGNNLGAKYAEGEYLFFLNPDTRVTNNTIDELYKFIKSNKNIGIVSPLLVDKNLKTFSTQSKKELTPLNAIYSFSFLRKIFKNKNIYNDSFFNKWNKKNSIEVETIPGAALMISKKLFNRIDGFDERFFLYFEENDLSKRVRDIGLKLYLVPSAKIIHEVGQSTKQISQRDDIFAKSRFLYFRKHYGLITSLFLEFILKLNKHSLIIFLILLIALFLRTVNLQISMPFIGDQGWFYLSARDLLVNNLIPLVGITSSHLWLHQGPLWTYMLSVALFLGNFNPLSGAYLTAAFGIGSTFLMYKLGSKMFSKNIGIIASFLYAVSPQIVFFERMPFDPSVVPFFTIIYFFSAFKWIMGNTKFFPICLFFLAVLYNLELATFTLVFPLIAFFIYGLIKKKSFVNDLLHLKNIFYSLVFLTIPMIPILIYDFSNGFKQTVIFLLWVIYKPFSFMFRTQQGSILDNFSQMIDFFIKSINKTVFEANVFISILLFLFAFAFLIYLVKKEKNIILNSNFLLFIFTFISLTGILISKTPSDAYLPILFPFIIFTVSIFLNNLLQFRNLKYLFMTSIFLLLSFNFYYSFKKTLNPDLAVRIKAVEDVITLGKGQKYNLIGRGRGSWFESFTMNYEYLLWWKGYAPSKNKENLKIIIKEDKLGISVYKL